MADILTLRSFASHLPLLLLFLISSSSTVSSAPCNNDDKNVLLAIKAAFNNAYHFASWTPNTDCCGWYGVACDFSNTGRVISLSVFADHNLTGSIPPAVGDLPYLMTLELHKLPKLTGSIPSSITKLTRLTLLDLSHNSLSGPVPSFLGEITSLKFLSLAFNQFSGSIPASLAKLPNLLAIHLDRNALTGTIPDSFGSFPKSFPPDLYLSNNDLSGPVPASLGRPEWDIIDLSRNRLTGDASFLFGASKPTTQIHLSRNLFSFDLTSVSSPLNLTSLDVSHNMIHGKIPDQVNQLNRLVLFNVSYNQLCGEIPAGSVTAKFDQYSYIRNKCLCGSPLSACK